MFIKNYGLFWRRDEVDWSPGRGRKFRLLGRQGYNRPGLRLCDFRYQQGIYILYGNHGPYYVGLTKAQGFGKRLKDHLIDDHAQWWDRFSWFGFCSVLTGTDDEGLCRLKKLASFGASKPKSVITDVEALLIRAMGLSNINQNNFEVASQWTQVKLDEVLYFSEKIQ